MKEPTRGPIFACLYPGLCDVARKHGYALAIHGSLVADMDLVAVPWTEEAVEAEALMKALKEHISALDFEELLRRDSPWLGEEGAKQIAKRDEKSPAAKPHGRLAWNLYLYAGTKIDLSVMPITGNARDAAAYKSQLRLCEEHAGTMAKDFDASLAVVQQDRDALKQQLAASQAQAVKMREAIRFALQCPFLHDVDARQEVLDCLQAALDIGPAEALREFAQSAHCDGWCNHYNAQKRGKAEDSDYREAWLNSDTHRLLEGGQS